MARKRVYRLRPAEADFELIYPCFAEGWEALARVDGQTNSDVWEPLDVRVVHEDGARRFKRADMPRTMNSSLVLSSEVIHVLAEVLDPYVEYLPTRCVNDDRAFFVVNPLVITDAFVESESELSRLPSGKIMLIYKWAFDPERLKNLVVFRTREYPLAVLFTEEFAAVFRKSGLTGYELEEVWAEPE